MKKTSNFAISLLAMVALPSCLVGAAGTTDDETSSTETLAEPLVVAAPCSQDVIDWVRAPIADDDPAKRYRVRLDCSLTLRPGDVVQKRIVFSGPEASGITLNCNGATIDGGKGTKNEGADMIEIASRLDEATGAWLWPTDIKIQNCKINGSMRIKGMGKNGEEAPVRESSRRDVHHVARVRAAAPTRITLDNLTVTAITRTPLYVAPGVTYVTLSNSELKGDSGRTAIYLDAESAYNTIKNNYIHVDIFDEWEWKGINTGVNRIGPQISVDASSYNKIINNRFSGLVGGGIFTYRNCGEGGTVRHSSAVHNQIINNVFYYKNADGDVPAVKLGSRGQWHYHTFLSYCGDDDGFPWGSSTSDYDHSKFNVVMQNQVYKFSPSKMLVQGDNTNRPNYIAHNETVTAYTEVERAAGCYVANGYKDFILHGESIDVFKGSGDAPVCSGHRATCTDGTLSWSTSTTCSIQEVPFSCQISGNNAGCSVLSSCPRGKKIVATRGACNLESGSVSEGELSSASINELRVVRRSDNLDDGMCSLASTNIRSGSATVEGALDLRSVTAACRERDSNGGDCQVRGTLYCR